MLGDRPRVDAATLSKADNEMLFVMAYECRRVGIGQLRSVAAEGYEPARAHPHSQGLHP